MTSGARDVIDYSASSWAPADVLEHIRHLANGNSINSLTFILKQLMFAIMCTSRVPVEVESSVWAISMKYRIIILIIIIISLGKIIYYRIWQTHHARIHACTHTRTYLRTHPPIAVQVVAVRWLGVNGRSVLHSNKQSRMRRGIRDSFGCLSRIKKVLGRTEMRTRDMMCVQSIRTVWDISREDRARIANCSLLSSIDRLKENYTIDDRIARHTLIG